MSNSMGMRGFVNLQYIRVPERGRSMAVDA